jgi:plasmid segregation protein ParM
MIIGVDNGNANTKTVHTVFTSGITEHDVKPPIGDELIKYNNKYYTLSGDRSPYTRDKTKDKTCFILTLFALSKEILEEDKYEPVIDLDLGVGLPPEHYGLQKEKFAKYFKSFGDTIEYEYNGKNFILNINSVHVFPQAYAAVAQKASELKTYTRTYIIDIGGYTTDILLLNKGKPDLTCCRSIENGIIKMNNTIKGRVNSAYDMKIEEDHIYDVLSGRKTILKEDVKDMIKAEAAKHATTILNELRELEIDLRTNPAIFVGGGALLLQEFIEKSDMTVMVEFMPDISANAVGYTILTNGALRKKNRKE